jgi:tRNA/tmRNA/rRNA uracil-C5-methylase (TrmA/RlmC/RlmD family)
LPEITQARDELLELRLGAPAAGGGFVARDEGGRVVFVRHGLSGELVLAELTESHARWARADAVEILESSPDRVAAPCRFAGRLGCGGCDYQHVSLAAQRRYKADLLAEQLRRVAKIERDVEVESFSETGLGTRTRIRFGVGADGRLGMRRRASNQLVTLDRCLLGVDALGEAELPEGDLPAGDDLQLLALEGAGPTSVALIEWSDEEPETGGGDAELLEDSGPPLQALVGEVRYRVSPGSFWQIHRAAPAVLVDAVLEGLAPRPGDHLLDLYAGVGLFSVPLAVAVGADGVVLAVESSPSAVDDAEANLRAFSQAQVVAEDVSPELLEEIAGGAVGAVLDPPRAGVPRPVLEALIAEPTLRRVVLVSCSPATFARDLKVLLDAGFELGSLRALDLFEMTEHLEVVAVLAR